MNFPVPWRCLLPSEAVDCVTYDNNAILRDLSDQTGAMIDISGDKDTPRRLSDRIVTISGQVDQKEQASRGIVDKLRKLQDIWEEELASYFVIIVPATAVPVIVGAKGATISEILATSGIELSIGKENVMGMPDTPIGLEGTAIQTVAAMSAIHRVVQEMADRGRLMPSDFKFRPDKAAAALASGAGQALPQVELPPSEHDPLAGLDPTNNYRTKAKLLVDTMQAGWLIGKGGRTIREMQTNSGAFLHMLREEDSPPILGPGERLIEICGRYERKLEGLQIVMRTADSMPGTQAPKETHMLVPKVLVQQSVLYEVAASCNCFVEAREFAEHDEAVVTIVGPISSRIRAAQAFLTRTDQAHIDGVVVALSIDGEVVGKHGRPREEIREQLKANASAAESTPEPSLPPRPVPPLPSARPTSEPLLSERGASDRGIPPSGPQASRPLEHSPAPQYQQREPAPRAVSDNYSGHAPSATLNQPLEHGPLSRSQQRTPEEAAWSQKQQSEPHGFRQKGPEDGSQFADKSVASPAGPGSYGRPVPEDPPCPAPSADCYEKRVADLTAGSLGGVNGFMSAGGRDVDMFLTCKSQCAQASSQLQLLLPEELLQRALVPSGHLQDVAQWCQVQIDLGIAVPPAHRHVLVTGTVASTAAASFWIQMGAARAAS